jgi:hypothetical protein
MTNQDQLDAVRHKYDQLVWQNEERKADQDYTERDLEEMNDAEANLEEQMEELEKQLK